jgi:hypothetical protein
MRFWNANKTRRHFSSFVFSAESLKPPTIVDGTKCLKMDFFRPDLTLGRRGQKPPPTVDKQIKKMGHGCCFSSLNDTFVFRTIKTPFGRILIPRFEWQAIVFRLSSGKRDILSNYNDSRGVSSIIVTEHEVRCNVSNSSLSSQTKVREWDSATVLVSNVTSMCSLQFLKHLTCELLFFLLFSTIVSPFTCRFVTSLLASLRVVYATLISKTMLFSSTHAGA